MRYDEIFERPIEDYTDQEIIDIALSHRSKAKANKGAKKKAPKAVGTAKPKAGKKGDNISNMLEQAMKTAKTRGKDNES